MTVPNLLTLATEIALKAWQCWERQKAPKRTHDLLKLFHSLEQDTQEVLEARMRKVSPDSMWALEVGVYGFFGDGFEPLQRRGSWQIAGGYGDRRRKKLNNNNRAI